MLRKKILFMICMLLVGAGLGYLLPRGAPHEATHSGGARSEGAPAERKVLYWYDPMYPGTHFDKPGPSPFMDMDLVPRYAEDEESAGIRIDPAQTHNLAVRTERVERGKLSFAKNIPANVSFNNYLLAKVQSRAEGFVEKIYALAVGDVVDAGAPLADITVPGWASDQSEYLLLKSQRANAAIVRGVRERMRLSGMPEEMLSAVDSTGKVQTRMTIHAPLGGVISALDVYPGMNIDKNMVIAVIQGTDPIWVTADVPERDLHLVNRGEQMRITLSAWPERVFYTDSFVLLPAADQETRTVPLRLSLNNSEGLLKPGMTAGVRLRGTGPEALLIPTQSLINLGDEQRVIVRADDGSFVPRTVRTLRGSGDKTAVASGVDAGEEVVASGLFLIDSEANLRGALDRMRRQPANGGERGEERQEGHARRKEGGR
jgi:Cu(I)/Ag(I) efflux system membrane fusion protein